MLSYKDFTHYFGSYLNDTAFQTFLNKTFTDLTSYDVSESDYIVSDQAKIELGFTNADAVYDDDENEVFNEGAPVFSHINFHPGSDTLINVLPFDSTFEDTREYIITKAGEPTQTNQGYMDFLDKNFLVDNYKAGDVVISIDYDADSGTINFIQIRDNTIESDLQL